MNRFLLVLMPATIAVCGLQGQTTDPMSSEVKQSYNNIKNNILKAADKMSAEDYNFKATPEVRTFGQLVLHTAEANLRTCTAVNGEAQPAAPSSATTKADLEAALKAAFAVCDKAYAGVTDATAGKMISAGRGQRSTLGLLWGTVVHDNEMYGTMSVYLRLKGLVPPSTEGRSAPAPK